MSAPSVAQWTQLVLRRPAPGHARPVEDGPGALLWPHGRPEQGKEARCASNSASGATRNGGASAPWQLFCALLRWVLRGGPTGAGARCDDLGPLCRAGDQRALPGLCHPLHLARQKGPPEWRRLRHLQATVLTVIVLADRGLYARWLSEPPGAAGQRRRPVSAPGPGALSGPWPALPPRRAPSGNAGARRSRPTRWPVPC